MTQARHHLINLSDTPCYHCIDRCVHCPLCVGEIGTPGAVTSTASSSYIKMNELSSLFAIDVCAYASLAKHLG